MPPVTKVTPVSGLVGSRWSQIRVRIRVKIRVWVRARARARARVLVLVRVRVRVRVQVRVRVRLGVSRDLTWVGRDQVVARGRCVGRRVRVLGEGPPAAPRREHITAADLQVVGEVAAHLVE